MTQDTKVKIWAIAISATISLVGVIYSATQVNAQKLDSKVDKVQYKEDCERTNERLKNVENIYSVLGELKEGQAELRTDIKWLKEKENNKQRQQ